MENLVDFALQERYKNIKKLGERLDEFATLIDWGSFGVVVGDIYTNTTEQGGRPNMDIVLMVKLLVLQSMYNLFDPELERQANDRISFMNFKTFPENPQSNHGMVFPGTVGKDRERQSDLGRTPAPTRCQRFGDHERDDPGCNVYHSRSRPRFKGHSQRRYRKDPKK